MDENKNESQVNTEKVTKFKKNDKKITEDQKELLINQKVI